MNFKNFMNFLLRFCFRAKSGEEGEDDARSAWPSDTLGYTRDTMAHYNATQYRKVEQIVIKVA